MSGRETHIDASFLRSVWLEVSKTNDLMELDHVIMLGHHTAQPFDWLFQLLQFTSTLVALK